MWLQQTAAAAAAWEISVDAQISHQNCHWWRLIQLKEMRGLAPRTTTATSRAVPWSCNLLGWEKKEKFCPIASQVFFSLPDERMIY